MLKQKALHCLHMRYLKTGTEGINTIQRQYGILNGM